MQVVTSPDTHKRTKIHVWLSSDYIGRTKIKIGSVWCWLLSSTITVDQCFYISTRGKSNGNEDDGDGDEPSIGAQRKRGRKTEDWDCPYRTAKTNIHRFGGKPFVILQCHHHHDRDDPRWTITFVNVQYAHGIDEHQTATRNLPLAKEYQSGAQTS